MACFWAADHKPQITLTVDFDWKTGVAAKDWSNVAKKGQVDVSLFFAPFIGLILLPKGYLNNFVPFSCDYGQVVRFIVGLWAMKFEIF